MNDNVSHHQSTWNNVKLNGRNGVPARVYSFKEMQYQGSQNNDYNAISIRGCRKNGHGWKPVCEHPSYCKNDRKSIYLGQQHHLSYGGHWHKNHMSSTLLRYKSAFRQDGMCFYTANHGGKHKDLCANGNSHAWKTATQNRHYLCAKVTGTWNDEVSHHRRTWNNIKLGSRNGVKSKIYSFKEMTYRGFNDKDYSTSSIKGCRQNGAGWKPVCEHPSYCKNDRKSVYLGQQHHLSYGGHWSNANMPSGLLRMKKAFRQDSMCFYAGNHGGKHRDLCAHGNSHAWRRATQNRHYLCAKVTGTWNDEVSTIAAHGTTSSLAPRTA